MFNIMIVEDDVNQRKLMSAVLEQYGYTVICADNGLNALDQLDKKHVDLIILFEIIIRFKFCFFEKSIE